MTGKIVRLGSKDLTIEHCQFEQDSPSLRNCFVCQIDDGVVVRSESIDTSQKLSCLLSLIGSESRLCCCQLEVIEEHWGAVTSQNRMVTLANKSLIPNQQIVHLSIPLPHSSHFPPDERMLPSMKERIRRLPHLVNIEGLLQYAAWVYFDLKKALDSFLFDATEEYSLAGKISDLKNEITSFFLQDKIERMKEIFNSLQENSSQDDAQRQTLETELLVLRNDLKQSLQKDCQVFSEIYKLINNIQKIHPELASLREKVLLVATLLESESNHRSWVNQLMILTLLNRRLGVSTAINCAKGGDQTNYAFALCLAVASMDLEEQSDDFLDLIINWDNRSRGELKEPLVVCLRNRIYSVFHHFKIESSDYQLQKGMIQDLDVLNLFPLH